MISSYLGILRERNLRLRIAGVRKSLRRVETLRHSWSPGDLRSFPEGRFLKDIPEAARHFEGAVLEQQASILTMRLNAGESHSKGEFPF